MSKKEKFKSYLTDIINGVQYASDKETLKNELIKINTLKGLYFILFNEFFID